jgi:hypothetical protein
LICDFLFETQTHKRFKNKESTARILPAFLGSLGGCLIAGLPTYLTDKTAFLAKKNSSEIATVGGCKSWQYVKKHHLNTVFLSEMDCQGIPFKKKFAKDKFWLLYKKK